jgi:hypothetical protein
MIVRVEYSVVISNHQLLTLTIVSTVYDYR